MSFTGVDISTLNGKLFSLIESYGNGGFKIGGDFHSGSVLLIEGEVFAWDVQVFTDISVNSLSSILASSAELCFLGCGEAMLRPPSELRQSFETANIALDFMSTGSACRSYNIAIGESRRTAAALLAI